jgi:lysozyme family protein
LSLASIRVEDPKAGFAIARTLPLEGGWSDSPADRGGATHYGISLRWALQEVKAHPDTIRMLDLDHDGDVDKADIRGLTQDGAADLYFQCIWRRGWYGSLDPQMIAWKCFDIAVNTGPKRAAVMLQSALNCLGQNYGIAVDQVVGPITRAAVAKEAKRDGGAELLNELRLLQRDFYNGLARKEPKLHLFLDGWLKRAAA